MDRDKLRTAIKKSIGSEKVRGAALLALGILVLLDAPTTDTTQQLIGLAILTLGVLTLAIQHHYTHQDDDENDDTP